MIGLIVLGLLVLGVVGVIVFRKPVVDEDQQYIPEDPDAPVQ